MTCYKSDGTTVPPMMFTSNPAFKIDGSEHHLAKKARKHFLSTARALDVKTTRIVYMPHMRGKFVKESHEIIQQYLAQNKLDDVPIFTDNGTIFAKDGQSLIESAGYRHVYLPAAVHQYLSVNDNNAHGLAKARWRAKVVDHTDDVTSSLTLLKELGSIDEGTIEGWFIRNYVLAVNNMETAMVERLIVGPDYKFRKWHNLCLFQYMSRFLSPIKRCQEVVWSKLDGPYWHL